MISAAENIMCFWIGMHILGRILTGKKWPNGKVLVYSDVDSYAITVCHRQKTFF